MCIVVNELPGSEYDRTLTHVTATIDQDLLTDINVNGYVRSAFRDASVQRLIGT